MTLAVAYCYHTVICSYTIISLTVRTIFGVILNVNIATFCYFVVAVQILSFTCSIFFSWYKFMGHVFVIFTYRTTWNMNVQNNACT